MDAIDSEKVQREIKKLEQHIRDAQRKRAAIGAAPKPSPADHALAFIKGTTAKGAVTADDLSRLEAERLNLDTTIAGLIEMRIELELKFIADDMIASEAKIVEIEAELKKIKERDPFVIQAEINKLEQELRSQPGEISQRNVKLMKLNVRTQAARGLLRNHQHILSGDELERKLRLDDTVDVPDDIKAASIIEKMALRQYVDYDKRLYDLIDRLQNLKDDNNE